MPISSQPSHPVLPLWAVASFSGLLCWQMGTSTPTHPSAAHGAHVSRSMMLGSASAAGWSPVRPFGIPCASRWLQRAACSATRKPVARHTDGAVGPLSAIFIKADFGQANLGQANLGQANLGRPTLGTEPFPQHPRNP